MMAEKESKKKVVLPQTIFMRDLRNQGQYRGMSCTNMDFIRLANDKFDRLSNAEKEKYTILANKENAKFTKEKGHTYQRDTLGALVQDEREKASRAGQYQERAKDSILKMCKQPGIEKKVFYAAHLTGISYMRDEPEGERSSFSFSEICFVKFSIEEGVIDKLTLFPMPPTITSGYRHEFNEHSEEEIGWREGTYPGKDQEHKVCYYLIKQFFNNGSTALNKSIDEPIYVQGECESRTRSALYDLFLEAGVPCPWVKDIRDWSQVCKIHKLETLISALYLVKTEGESASKEDLSIQIVKNHWKEIPIWLNKDDLCDRHAELAIPHNCPKNVLLKCIQGSFQHLMEAYKDMYDLEKHVPEIIRKHLDSQMKAKDKRRKDEKAASNESDNWGCNTPGGSWETEPGNQYRRPTAETISMIQGTNQSMIRLNRNPAPRPETSIHILYRNQASINSLQNKEADQFDQYGCMDKGINLGDGIQIGERTTTRTIGRGRGTLNKPLQSTAPGNIERRKLRIPSFDVYCI